MQASPAFFRKLRTLQPIFFCIYLSLHLYDAALLHLIKVIVLNILDSFLLWNSFACTNYENWSSAPNIKLAATYLKIK